MIDWKPLIPKSGKRERKVSKDSEKEKGEKRLTRVLENGLRKIFPKTVFLFLSKRFTVNKQIFSVGFGFTALQTFENAENVLRKTFYFQTN